MNEIDISPTSIISLFDTTRDQRNTFVEDVVDRVANGLSDPVKLHLQIKCMEEICKAIKENKFYKDSLLTEASKYGKGFEFHNAKIEVRSAAGKYDYSHDTEWARLSLEIKNREKYLKVLPPEGIDRVTIDGEVVKDYPPKYTPGADTLFVTLK